MHFGLSEEISEDAVSRSYIIFNISMSLKNCLKNKHYGKDLEKLIIGIICVRPEVNFFFKERTKYTKAEKMLEYDVKIDHEKFIISNELEIKQMLFDSIINSLSIIKIKIPNFYIEQLEYDMRECFKELLKSN